MRITAEWAIARLQIEGARQKTLSGNRGKPLDLKSKLTPQKGGGVSISSLQAASDHLTEQDHSLTSVDEVDPGDAPSTVVFVHGSYKCTSGKSSGRLFVTSLDVRFERTLGLKDQWMLKYETIHRMEKVRSSDPTIHHYLVSSH